MRDPVLKVLLAAVATLAVIGGGVAMADPPDHAKAHGWRKKHDSRYVGYTGRDWDRDYGVLEGTCRRKEIGTVVGAVLGGAIGSQVGGDDNRAVAIIVGSVLGAMIGRHIGRDLDDGDRACVGQALELGQAGRAVRWVNERTNVNYVVTPLPIVNGDAKNCRRFDIKAALDGKNQNSKGMACRDAGGTWKMQ